MKKKDLENKIVSLENEIRNIKSNVDIINNQIQNLKDISCTTTKDIFYDLRRRAYLMETNFLGSLYDKKVIERFKDTKFGLLTFDDAVQEIKAFNVDILDEFYRALNGYELKQKILDIYRPIKTEKKLENNKK